MQFKKAGEFILTKLKNELPQYLSYHTIEHVLDVFHSAEEIGRSEGISGDSLKLLLTAAWFHDAGFIQCSKGHEEVSCDFAKKILPQFGYTSENIEIICGIIRATKIPQLPQNHLEEILADADLDYLGREDFYSIGNTLFKELVTQGILQTEEEWNHLQVRFLQDHHYFTSTAIHTRKQKKELHLQEIREKLEKLK